MLVLQVDGYITIDKDSVVFGRYDMETSAIVEVDTSNLMEFEIISMLERGEIFVLVERTVKKGEYDDMSLDVEVDIAY